MKFEPIITRNVGVPDAWEIEVYLARGGYQAVRKALTEYTPDQIIESVSRAKLRGRGGAGFPTGRKWSLIPKNAPQTYLVCNADESEPGTFSNHDLLIWDPHLLIEGMIIGAYAIRATTGFIYLRGEFGLAARRLERALAQARAHGFLGPRILGTEYSLEIYLFRGAGAYICGEETALLESIEGNRPMPRPRPPYYPPAIGLYGKPTAVNNVETLCNVPFIVLNGPEWYLSIGNPPKNPGTKVFSISGLVRRPGNYEAPLGTTLGELIFEYAGGLHEGRRFKAVTPGGTSTPLLTDQHLDVKMDYDSLPAVGTYLGSTGMIVMDDTVCIPCAVHRLSTFYRHESCGKCTPCREGTAWIEQILRRIVTGRGRLADLDLLLDICANMRGRTTVCALGDFATFPVGSALKYFRDEFEYHIRHNRCPTAGVAVSR